MTPPHSDTLSQIMQAPLIERQLVHQGPLSIVERVVFGGPILRPMFLKTIRPALASELRAHRLASSFPICAAPLVASSETDASAEAPWLPMQVCLIQPSNKPLQLTVSVASLSRRRRLSLYALSILNILSTRCC